MTLRDARFIFISLYHLLILGVCGLGIWLGLAFNQQGIFDGFTVCLAFHLVTFNRNGLIPFLLRRALEKWNKPGRRKSRRWSND